MRLIEVVETDPYLRERPRWTTDLQGLMPWVCDWARLRGRARAALRETGETIEAVVRGQLGNLWTVTRDYANPKVLQ